LIPFVDLASDFALVEKQARKRIDDVLARQLFVHGPQTAELERAIQELTGARFAIACSSGSDALYLALLALGIGPGDAVIVPAFTFFASAGAVVRAGAQPVFCDIDDRTFLAGAAQMAAAVDRHFDGSLRHRRTRARLRALLPVHLYGRMTAMDELVSYARERDLRVIEDAAQALGARSDAGAAAAVGDAGCLSFYPTKNLGGPGDGGMVVTNDQTLARRLSRLRVHGAAPGSYEHEDAGINARMNELVAAVLNAKLSHLAAWNARRQEIAALYERHLAPAAAANILILPQPATGKEHVWHQLTVRVPCGRDAVQARLEREGIATRVFYPLPLHLQPCLAAEGGARGDLPVSERMAEQVLSLPIYPSLADEAVAAVCAGLSAACGDAAHGQR